MTANLDTVLSSTQNSLKRISVDDALIREILSYRLLVERLGETDNSGWWESIILTDTGRDRLAEITPKTSMKTRIDIAQRVGKKAEQDRLEANTISLFYLGPTVEAQVSAELEDISGPSEFEQLESLSITLEETGWTNGLIDAPEFEYMESNETIRFEMEELDDSQLKSRTTLRRVARGCFAGYGWSTHGALRVPYFEVEL
jgi:hypothetical protein